MAIDELIARRTIRHGKAILFINGAEDQKVY